MFACEVILVEGVDVPANPACAWGAGRHATIRVRDRIVHSMASQPRPLPSPSLGRARITLRRVRWGPWQRAGHGHVRWAPPRRNMCPKKLRRHARRAGRGREHTKASCMLSSPVMTSITESSTTVTLSLAVALNAAPGLAIIGVTLSGAPMVEANNPSTVAVICAKTSDVFGRMGYGGLSAAST